MANRPTKRDLGSPPVGLPPRDAIQRVINAAKTEDSGRGSTPVKLPPARPPQPKEPGGTK